MSFDLMRRHRRKVEVPLAIFVVITFVLFFGSFSVSNVIQDWRQSRAQNLSALDAQLLAQGRDLISAGLMADPRIDARADDRTDQVRNAYIASARWQHYVPAKLAEEMGIRVSDEDLSRELARRLQESPWHLEPMKPGETQPQYRQRYEKAMASHGLSSLRYEQLLRENMAIARLQELFDATGSASEAEMYNYYAMSNQKVRVQYFQRRAADFVAEVEEASKKEAAEAAAPKPPPEKAPGPEPAPGAAAAPAGEAGKAAEEPKRKGVSEQDVRKRYDEDIAGIKMRGKPASFQWNSEDISDNPEYFTEERAQIEYLVARAEKFAKDVTVKPEEIEEYYKNNKFEFQEEEKAPAKDAKDPKAAKDAKGPGDGKDAKAGEEAKPKYKPLDKVSDEIRKTLTARRALDAAEAALKAAVGEYNDADPDKRPVLGALAAKHKLESPRPAGPAAVEDLEVLPYLKDVSWMLDRAFNESARRQAGTQFLEPVRTKEDDKDKELNAVVALRVVKFEPRKLRDFDQVKGVVRERLVLEAALRLAKEAAEADRKLLADGKLDPKRVRLSVLLGPRDETVYQTMRLALGEASKSPYAYRELLGDEAAAEKERQKQKDQEREKAAGRKQDKPAVADSYPKGYRVVVLAERSIPTIDEFRKDPSWRSSWRPEMSMDLANLPEQFRQYYLRQMHQMRENSPDRRWRSYYLNGWMVEKVKRSAAANR